MSVDDDKLKELGIVTPQESIAKAIERLTSKDRIKLMSNLKNKKDVFRLSLMYSVGEELGYDWLINYADNMLMLYVSTDNGRGRRDVVEVVKQPLLRMAEGLKEKITSFIKSE